jgi:hypothetical protein
LDEAKRDNWRSAATHRYRYPRRRRPEPCGCCPPNAVLRPFPSLISKRRQGMHARRHRSPPPCPEAPPPLLPPQRGIEQRARPRNPSIQARASNTRISRKETPPHDARTIIGRKAGGRSRRRTRGGRARRIRTSRDLEKEDETKSATELLCCRDLPATHHHHRSLPLLVYPLPPPRQNSSLYFILSSSLAGEMMMMVMRTRGRTRRKGGGWTATWRGPPNNRRRKRN